MDCSVHDWAVGLINWKVFSGLWRTPLPTVVSTCIMYTCSVCSPCALGGSRCACTCVDALISVTYMYMCMVMEGVFHR